MRIIPGSTCRTQTWTIPTFITRCFAVAALTCIPGAADIADKLTGRVLEYTLRRFTHLYEEGEVTLSEVFGRTIPDMKYQGVGEFWAKVHRNKMEKGSLVEISGLLSPYGPLMPAHPMSRPGYTVEGWAAMGDLCAEDTEEYDTRDGFIYGDRVIRLSTPRKKNTTRVCMILILVFQMFPYLFTLTKAPLKLKIWICGHSGDTL